MPNGRQWVRLEIKEVNSSPRMAPQRFILGTPAHCAAAGFQVAVGACRAEAAWCLRQ
jgi:hypothetical protein